jgi:hypothetical protein
MDETIDMQRLAARLAAAYCPLLDIALVVAVARLEFAGGLRPIIDAEAAARQTLDDAAMAITSSA